MEMLLVQVRRAGESIRRRVYCPLKIPGKGHLTYRELAQIESGANAKTGVPRIIEATCFVPRNQRKQWTPRGLVRFSTPVAAMEEGEQASPPTDQGLSLGGTCLLKTSDSEHSDRLPCVQRLSSLPEVKVCRSLS